MKVVVDPNICMGCGICESTAPQVFQLNDDNVAIVLVDVVPSDLEADVRQAVDDCPEQAISIVA